MNAVHDDVLATRRATLAAIRRAVGMMLATTLRATKRGHHDPEFLAAMLHEFHRDLDVVTVQAIEAGVPFYERAA